MLNSISGAIILYPVWSWRWLTCISSTCCLSLGLSPPGSLSVCFLCVLCTLKAPYSLDICSCHRRTVPPSSILHVKSTSASLSEIAQRLSVTQTQWGSASASSSVPNTRPQQPRLARPLIDTPGSVFSTHARNSSISLPGLALPWDSWRPSSPETQPIGASVEQVCVMLTNEESLSDATTSVTGMNDKNISWD